MNLGDNILKFRKKIGLSQEELGEKINVTRQTISNWELNETTPNPDQLKLLSQIFNISIDELLNNDIRSVVEEKVSNTEKLAGIIIKILKIFGILVILAFAIEFVAFILFIGIRSEQKVESVTTLEMSCTIGSDDYTIGLFSDGEFSCDNCSKEMYRELEDDYINADNIDKSGDRIRQYFKEHNGTCE